MKLIIMQSSAVPSLLIPLRSRYLSQQIVIHDPQPFRAKGTSALEGSGWLTLSPCRITPESDLLAFVQEARWARLPLWTGAENFTPTGIGFPDRPTCSEWQYRLRYPGPHILHCATHKCV
jgi:hypothetical protein